MASKQDQSEERAAGEGAPKERFYGRRAGRRLRPAQKSLLHDLLPKLSLPQPLPAGPLDLAAAFGRKPRALWLEIGFGTGEHLAWQAERHPDVGFLGAEFFINGVAALLRRIDQANLDNIRLYRGDARALIAALPDDSVSRTFMLFPDPWPKTRHHKRRLIQAAFLDRLGEIMTDHAELRLATDHPGYLDWMLRQVCRHPAFEWRARGPGDWRQRSADWPATRYEEKALAAGRQSAYLRFRRRPR